MMPIRDFTLVMPDLYLAALAVVVLLVDLLLPARWRKQKATIAGLGLLLGFYPIITLWGHSPTTEFWGSYAVDNYALFFKGLFISCGLLVILFSVDFFRNLRRGYGEYFSFIIFMVLGMSLLASVVDIIALYIAFELVSIGGYILVGYLKRDARSNEASLKYFIYGAVASAIILYGLTLLYGLGGSTNILEIQQNLADMPGLLGPIVLMLILVGLGFKISMVPFHAWAPDVYEGAPTPVTAFISVGPKAAGFAILVRLLWPLGPQLLPMWPAALAVLATVTMFAGNILAIRQTDIKRMLAYSSIAHAGYILIGVVVGAGLALEAILYYFVAYLLMNLGAFAVVIIVERNTNSTRIADYTGLARSAPGMAAALVIFLLSLTGIPPTAGFVGKLLLFAAAINSEQWAWLAVVGIINSAISLYYYMNIVQLMYFSDEPGPTLSARPAGALATVFIALIGTLAVGLLPYYWLTLASRCAWLMLPL